jgi:microcin C transport system substrate-binding protein
VKFSFDTLRGPLASPIWKNYWADVKAVVVLDERTVRFEFLRRNRELHMIVASLPVFSRDWIPTDKSFDQVVQELPIGSGPYVVEKFDLGKRITYLRQSDYWAAQKPSRAGQFNFQRISFQYYKDVFARLEALKAGEFDFIHENTAKNWARSYKGRPFDSGSLIKTEMPTSNAAGLQALYFNLRRPVFQDVRVRRAIELAMDFEWMNRQLFYDQYRRSDSYFTNTEMAAVGAPNPSEVSLLKALSAKTGWALSPELLGPVPTPASAAAPSSLRDNLRQARALLTEAGYQLVDGRLVNDKGQPLQFEILISQKSWERVIAPFARNLAKLGIEARSRVTDNSLYKKRLDDYDYDMVVHWYLSSQNPGNELLFRFTSQSAEQPGADNYIGIADPLVDAAITSVISARNRSDMVLAAKVLDRLLRHGHYAIAHWHNNVHRVAYRQGLQGPTKPPLYYHSEDWVMATWWWSQKGPQ